jgi:hypothetical protein
MKKQNHYFSRMKSLPKFLIVGIFSIIPFLSHSQCTIDLNDCSVQYDCNPSTDQQNVYPFNPNVDEPITVAFDQFMGINLRRSDPIEFAKCVTSIREYHNWKIDEIFQDDFGNAIGPESYYPRNRYTFHPTNEGTSLINSYDLFYEQLNNDFNSICATMTGGSDGVTNQLSFNPSFLSLTPPSYIDLDGDICNNTVNPDFSQQTNPESYIWRGDYITQFVNRYGFTNNPNDLLDPINDKNNGDPASLQTAGLVQYIENWNEQDDWFTDDQDACFLPNVYGTMSSVDFDGYGGTLMAENGCNNPVSSYPIGISSLNRNIKFVMGGLSKLDECYLQLLGEWFECQDKDFPFHVLNFHHYSNGTFGGPGLGISPEADDLQMKLKKLDLIRDEHFNGLELWLSEFGYNTNILPGADDCPSNTYGIEPISHTNNPIDADVYEVHGQWIVRSFLAIAAADFDKAFVYEIRDATSMPEGTWDSKCGLLESVDKDYAPKKAWFYTYSLKNIMEGMDFKEIVSDGSLVCDDNKPRIYKYSDSGTDIYAIWSPTSCNVPAYDFDLNEISDIAQPSDAFYYKLEVPSITGIIEDPTISGNEVIVPVSERPIFVVVNGNQVADVECLNPIEEIEKTCTSVKLSWEIPPGQVHDFYEIWYALDVPNFNPDNPDFNDMILFETNVPGHHTQALVAGLVPNTSYYIYIVPHVDGNSAGWCEPIPVMTPPDGNCDINLNDPAVVANIELILPNGIGIDVGLNEQHLYDGIISSSGNPPDIVDGINCCNLPDGLIDDGNNTWYHNEGTMIEVTFSEPYDIDVIYLHDGNGIGTFTVQYLDGTSWEPYINQYVSSLGGGTAPFNGGTWVAFANDIDPCQPIEMLRIFGEQQGDAIGELVICGKPYASYQNITGGFSSVVDCNTVDFESIDSNADLNYLWDFGDGMTSNEMNPTHIYGNIQEYQVTLTVSNACNEVISTIPVTTIDCAPQNCDCPDDDIILIVGNQDASNVLPANPTGLLNIVVQGTLNFDIDYTMPISSNICMGAGARIVVEQDQELTLLNNHIRGCEERWEGIIVEDGGRLETIGFGGMRIEDAQHAIYPQSGGVLDINGTIFKDNYIGIYFNDIQGDFILDDFTGVTFLGDLNDDLLPHYNPQDPDDGPKPFAGIHTINQSVLTLATLNNVTFDRLRNGIVTERCELTVRNASFTNILRGDYDISGNGIYAKGGGEILNVANNVNTVFSNNFDNCTRGIRCINMNPYIFHTEMTNMATGILVEGGVNTNIFIGDNDIHLTTNAGIWLDDTDGAASISVYQNEIHVDNFPTPFTSPRATGIRVTENNIPHENARIFDNILDLDNAVSGISLNGSNGIAVRCNQIDADALNHNYSAIRLTNSSNLEIGGNYIDGDFGTTISPQVDAFSPAGIRVRATSNTLYDCNNIEATDIGVQFDMMCPNTQLQTTVMENHRWGLHYRETGVTGQQPLNNSNDPAHANRWVGNWGGSSSGARHENPNQLAYSLSRYTMSDNAQFAFPPNPFPNNPLWIDSDGRTEIEDCNFDNTCVVIGKENDIKKLDEYIADETFTVGVYEKSMKWMANRYLFQKMSVLNSENEGLGNNSSNEPVFQNPSTEPQMGYDDDPIYQSFYQANKNKSVGQFVAADMGLRDLYKTSDATSIELNKLYNRRMDAISAIVAINQLLETATGNDSLQLISDRIDEVNKLKNYSQENRNLVQSLEANRYGKVDNFIDANENIDVEEVFEENEKIVTHIYLQTIAKGIFNFKDEHKALLYDIAKQCPYIGGTAVFRARNMLIGHLSDYVFDDNECDNDAQLFIGNGGVENNYTENSTFKVFPNPAQNEVSITFEKSETTVYQAVSVYNIHGQKVLQMDISDELNTHKFSTRQLMQGVYYLKVLDDTEETIFSEKLIIIK